MLAFRLLSLTVRRTEASHGMRARRIGWAMVAVFCSLLIAPMAASLAVEAQTAGQVYRVGLIATQTPVAKIVSDPAHPLNSFRREMRDRGYVEGTNFALELRSIEGKIERASGVLDHLIGLNVHVIVTVGVDVTREAKRLTTTAPIVMAPVRLPVEEGLVASLSRPGGNITGLTFDAGAELEGRRLALLKENFAEAPSCRIPRDEGGLEVTRRHERQGGGRHLRTRPLPGRVQSQ